MPIINGQLLETIDITQNGRYDIAKYISANVNVSGGGSGNIEELNVTPSTSAQTINATASIDGYAPVKVAAVTSSIDSNITADNIKSGVSILGVTGNVVELNNKYELIATPNTSETAYSTKSPYTGYTRVVVKAVTSNIDYNIQPENIKSGVNILGVTGNYIGENKGYLIDNEGNFVNILQNHIDSGVTNPINLSQIKHINNYSFNFLYDSFYDRNKFSLGKPPRVDLNNLETITGTYSCRNAFSNNYHFYNNMMHGVGNINMGKLTSITGDYTCYNMFQDSLFLTLDLSSLTTISGEYTCYGMFENSRHVVREPEPVESDSSESESLDDEINENINWEDWEREYRLIENPYIISFPSLTTISGEYACQSMFENFRMIDDNWDGEKESIISFPSLENITSYAGAFNKAFTISTVYAVEFPKLTEINEYGVFESAFYECGNLSIVDFPLLETIRGGCTFKRAFESVHSGGSGYHEFTEISFPNLKYIIGYKCFLEAFKDCIELRDIYFNKVEKLYSDYSPSMNNFKNMLSGCTDVTIHFPANLNPSKVSVLDTYPDFGGTNTTILFDL